MINKTAWRIKNKCGQTHSICLAHSVSGVGHLGQQPSALRYVSLASVELDMLLWRCCDVVTSCNHPTKCTGSSKVPRVTSPAHRKWAGNHRKWAKRRCREMIDLRESHQSWNEANLNVSPFYGHIFDIRTLVFLIVKFKRTLLLLCFLGFAGKKILLYRMDVHYLNIADFHN